MAGKLKPPSKEVTSILERERGGGGAPPCLYWHHFSSPCLGCQIHPEPTWNQVAIAVTPAEMFSPFYILSWVNLFALF